MVEIKPSKLGISQARRDFYLNLSELFIGLYPDSRAANAGPVDRETLPDRLRASYQQALSLARGKGRQRIERDFGWVTKLVGEYETVLESEREGWLEAHRKERQYLTNQAVGYSKRAAQLRGRAH